MFSQRERERGRGGDKGLSPPLDFALRMSLGDIESKFLLYIVKIPTNVINVHARMVVVVSVDQKCIPSNSSCSYVVLANVVADMHDFARLNTT